MLPALTMWKFGPWASKLRYQQEPFMASRYQVRLNSLKVSGRRAGDHISSILGPFEIDYAKPMTSPSLKGRLWLKQQTVHRSH